ncbi:MAG: STAS domain-containing protein [Actinomycetota bacterium]|nr:STAS domain-containing protein [Actinomycetota bacterium]
MALDRRHQGMVIVRASGQIDSTTAPKLSAALHRELDGDSCRLLVVDLRTAEFVGTQGIVVLANAGQHANAYNIHFSFIARGAVRRLLQPLEEMKNFDFYDDL